MPIDVNEVLTAEESVLGRFQIEILAPDANGWSPAVMAIEAMVTNYRLLLKPFKKKYQHASLPNYYITSVDENVVSNFPCISISIKTGHVFHIVIPRRHRKSLYNNLIQMRVPKPKFKMDENVALDDVQRLVAFFERWQPA